MVSLPVELHSRSTFRATLVFDTLILNKTLSFLITKEKKLHK